MGSKEKNMKIGDVVFLYKNEAILYQISDIEERRGKKYYWLKRDLEDRFAEKFHERYVHRATDEKEIEKYLYYISPEYKGKVKNAAEEAEKWLKGRQEELKGLSFQVYETDLWPEQKALLRESGYFCYDLRSWDEGGGYNIEKAVLVNHIGCWVTDTDLTPYFNEGTWVGIDELYLADMKELPFVEISELLEKGKQAHFAKRDNGSLEDKLGHAKNMAEPRKNVTRDMGKARG